MFSSRTPAASTGGFSASASNPRTSFSPPHLFECVLSLSSCRLSASDICVPESSTASSPHPPSLCPHPFFPLCRTGCSIHVTLYPLLFSTRTTSEHASSFILCFKVYTVMKHSVHIDEPHGLWILGNAGWSEVVVEAKMIQKKMTSVSDVSLVMHTYMYSISVPHDPRTPLSPRLLIPHVAGVLVPACVSHPVPPCPPCTILLLTE